MRLKAEINLENYGHQFPGQIVCYEEKREWEGKRKNEFYFILKLIASPEKLTLRRQW